MKKKIIICSIILILILLIINLLIIFNNNQNNNNNIDEENLNDNDDEKIINTNIDFDKYINEIETSENLSIKCYHTYEKDGDPYEETIKVSNDIIKPLLNEISKYSEVEPLPDGIGNPFATYKFYITYDNKYISISTSGSGYVWFLNSDENNLSYSFSSDIIKIFESLIITYKK